MTQSLEHDIEISSTKQLAAHLDAGGALTGIVISGSDLGSRDLEDLLAEERFENTVFLGCEMPDTLLARIRETGGIVFPPFADLPFNPYRSTLYSVAELMEGYQRGIPETLEATLDARIYNYYKSSHSPGMTSPFLETLACRVHDHAIDRALDDILRPAGEPERRVVGIMGGHKLRRDDPGFLSVTRIAHRLTEAGYYIATGGGPGAMEAGNLGAWLSSHPDGDIETAVDLLKPAPTYLHDHYIDLAYDVLEIEPSGQGSIAIPTWFYGHEPSNLFSKSIAKYFANSIREDGLLTIATHGIIFSPGSAGTIQEIFQDAAQNHYGTPGVISPMVFLGLEYWTRYRPVVPLLSSMSAGKDYAEMIHITDDPTEAIRFIGSHPPRVPRR